MSSETRDTLNARMEIDHVIEVTDTGDVVDRSDMYAPSLYDSALETTSEWTLLDGFSGQDRYSGPIMHASEYVGGRMATWILEHPGIYVALVDYPLDDTEPEGWAVAFMEPREWYCATHDVVHTGYVGSEDCSSPQSVEDHVIERDQL